LDNKELYENMNKSISIKTRIGVLPIVIFLSGIVLFASFIFYNIFSIGNSFTNVKLPSNSVINLKNKGEYTIFYEYNDNLAKENYEQVSNMDISIADINSKNKVQINKTSANFKYSNFGTTKSAFLKFKVEEAGDYEISGSSKIGTNNKITISIIQGFLSKILFTVIGSLIIMIVTILSGIFIIFGRIKNNMEWNF